MMAAAAGQETNSPAPLDFAPAFNQLAALGMPALDAGAKWSKLPDPVAHGMGDYEFQEMFRTLKGNGWMLGSTDGKTRVLPAGQTELSTLDESSGNSTGRGKPQKITEADLAKDFQGILKFLEKKKAESSRYSGSYGVGIGGQLLLLATQCHQTGQTRLANELTAAVFDTWPSREAVVDAAVTALAEREFQKISQEFFSSGDWVAYHASLTGLQKKFPRGWVTGQAITLLLPQLAKQAAGEKPPALSLPGIELDPRALEAVARLAAKPKPESAEDNDEALLKRAGINLSNIPAAHRASILQSLRMNGEGGNGQLNVSSYWILEKPDGKEKSESLLSPLTALKIEALPMLAAMLDDPFLTPFPHPDQRGFSSMYFSSSDSEAERIERAYQSMARPASRGDIARMLLEYAVPRDESNSEETDAETLREQILDFWKKHRKSSPDDLAITFLQEGNSSQQSQAAEILMASNDPKHFKAFEDHILGSDSAISQYRLVQNYLRARKAAAKPFFDSYAKAVREQTAGAGDDDNRLPWEAREAGGIDKILKNLESFVGGKSYRAIAKDIANSNPKEADGAIRSLLELMKAEPYTRKLYALLEGAVATDQPEIRGEFVSKVFYINDATEETEDEEADVANDSKPTLRKLPEAEVRAWRKLMADQRPVHEKSGDSDLRKETTIGDLAMSAVCYSASANHYGRIDQAIPIIRKDPTAVFLEHSEAILTGKKPPDLPDPSRVKPERLRAIVEAVGARAPLEIHPFLETLTLDERAAWNVWRKNPGDIEIPQSVLDLQSMVFRRSEVNHLPYPVVTDTAPIDVGFALSMESMKSASDTFAKDLQKLSLTTIRLKAAAFGPGLEISAVRSPLPVEDEKNPDIPDAFTSEFKWVAEMIKDDKTAEGCVLFSIKSNGYGPDGHEDMFEHAWVLENGKSLTGEKEIDQIDDLMKRVLSKDTPNWINFRIQILSKSDANKILAMIPEEKDDNILPSIE